MQDFNDILNGVTDGTKDVTVNAVTANGAANLKAAVTLGASSSNDLTVNGALASTIVIKTNNSFAIGASTKGLSGLFLGNAGVGATCQIISASHAATRNYTVPDCAAAANFVMSESAQTANGVVTWTNGLKPGTSQDTFNNYLNGGAWTPTFVLGATGQTLSTAVGVYWRIGNAVFFSGRVTVNGARSGTGVAAIGGLPFTVLNSASRRYGAQFTNISGVTVVGTNTGNIYGDIAPGSTTININYTNSGGATANATETSFSSGSGAIDMAFNGWFGV